MMGLLLLLPGLQKHSFCLADHAAAAAACLNAQTQRAAF
jgi:hypothetical protein